MSKGNARWAAKGRATASRLAAPGNAEHQLGMRLGEKSGISKVGNAMRDVLAETQRRRGRPNLDSNRVMSSRVEDSPAGHCPEAHPPFTSYLLLFT